MDASEMRATVLQTLTAIAPKIGPDEIDPAKPLRDQVDLDSMDWLNFLIGLHQKLKVIYPRRTMHGL